MMLRHFRGSYPGHEAARSILEVSIQVLVPIGLGQIIIPLGPDLSCFPLRQEATFGVSDSEPRKVE